MLYEISALAGRPFALLWDCTHRDRNLAQEIQGCSRDRADFVKAENNSPDRESSPSDRVRLGAVEIAMEVSNRRKFLRFSITSCNLLHPWLLCQLFHFGLLANRRNTLRFRARGSTKSRDYIMT